tara:strand:- start:206 stop:520 length:315 start_codon:yes stop_codon:yes gene_type:complete
MSDFKVGDLVNINYGDVELSEPEYGIIVKIDHSVETNVKIYRIKQTNYDWIVPYVKDELRRCDNDKPIRQPKTENGIGDNQKKDAKERSQTYREDREWGHWGDR